MLLKIAVLVGATAAATVRRDGCNGFAASCGRAYAQNGTSGHVDADLLVVATYCIDQAGERNYNPTVKINDCLSNSFGQLTAGTGFAYSCHDYGIDPIGAKNVFHATCGDGHGSEKKTQIDLNTVLCNLNGQLSCAH
ncbi:hypothetical protein NLG97_g5071 [Lecanicillium saksenae]|uniref:Uncharacterized protein n=1 Tax=Lecanicillium saksenae TaxID=468837 RepID=A0ACC1QVY2_9HYPO|nr:hypothetical protein NLG97_g5071 [Lecanicillium saksenae]